MELLADERYGRIGGDCWMGNGKSFLERLFQDSFRKWRVFDSSVLKNGLWIGN